MKFIPQMATRVARILTCWLACGAGLAAAPANLLTNPGFESGTAGWAVYSGGTIQAVTTTPYAGAQAGRSTNRTNVSHGLRQDIRTVAVPGTCYIASARVRTSSATPVEVKVAIQQTDGWGARSNTVKSVQVGSSWTLVSGLFRYDVNGSLTVLNFYLNGPPVGVDLFVDDASFTPVDTEALENLLLNPGFESGSANWIPHGPTTVAATPASHTGTGAVTVSNRTATWQGVAQSVFGKTEDGRMYSGAGWVTTDSATPAPAILTVEVVDSSGSRYFQIASGTVSNATWTWISGTVTLPATTGLTNVKFYVEGPPAGVALKVDNCYFAPATGLRRAAAAFPGLRLGGVSGVSTWAENPRFRSAMSAHFHLSSTENSLKMSDTEPADNIRRFAEANAVVELGIARGGAARGHTFVWHSGLPGWVNPATSTPAQLQTILWDNLDTTGAAFRGRLPYWDVVNEAINDGSGTLRSTLWYDAPGIGYAANGDQYIRESFIRARAADPHTQLFYNDYSTESVNSKSDGVYTMLAGFLTAGVPVDGVGFQSHFAGLPSASSTRANFQRFQDLGLDLHITELDIRIPVDANGFASAADLATQGDSYFNYFGSALGYSRMKVIQTWGVYDGASWIPGFFPGTGQALPFDFNLDRKPAYWGIWNSLAGQAEKLTVVATSSGDTQGTVTDTLLSANSARRLYANAANDSITLRVHVPLGGQWNVKLGALRHAAGGRMQLAVAPPGSTTFSDVGTVQETYAASNSAVAFNLGTTTFATPGEWQFRLTVTGKSGSASDYDLVLDYIRLTPVACAPVVENLPDQSIPLNSSMPARLFLAEDDVAQGTLQITATSNNPSLLPPASIVLAGESPYYTIAATPAADQLGTTTIGVIASDGTLNFTENFTLTVTGTALQAWRQQHFGSAANTGSAADAFDADGDGETNLLEFATAQNPLANSAVAVAAAVNAGTLEFTYQRSKAAVSDGLVFTVEWSDSLAAGTWSGAGIANQNPPPIAQDLSTETLQILVPAGSGRRFVRLKVRQL